MPGLGPPRRRPALRLGTMTDTYVLLDAVRDPDFVVLDTGFTRDRHINFEALRRQEPVLERGWPTGDVAREMTAMKMDRDFRRHTRLGDLVVNADDLLIASPRMAALLSEHESALEFLPLLIRDHKGKIATKDHVVVHPTPSIDCLNESCVEERNSLDEHWVYRMPSMRLVERKIPKKRRLFRVQGVRGCSVVHQSLASAIEEADLSGVCFWPVSAMRSP